MKVRLRDKTGIRLYRYLVEDVDRHANVRIYFRRKGQPKIRLREIPGTDAFEKEYQRAFSAEMAPAPTPAAVQLRWGQCVGCARNITPRQHSNRWLRAPARFGAGSSKRFASAPATSGTR
jgi:hypothetical protein